MIKNWMIVLALAISLAMTGTAMAQTDTANPAADEKNVENVSPASPQASPDFWGGRHGRFHDGQWSGGPMAKFINDDAVKKLQDDLNIQEKAFHELLLQDTVDEAKAKELTQKISDLRAQLETKRLEHILAFKKTNPDWQPGPERHPMMGSGHRGFHDGPGNGRQAGKGYMMMGMDQDPRFTRGHHGMRGHRQMF